MNDNKAAILIGSLVLVPIAGVICIAGWGYNNTLNNKTINKPAFHTESIAKGIAGHVEYTKYSDGSQDVVKYPATYYTGSELYQDLNGDGLVDRIRKNDSYWKLNRLNNILVRKFDYDANTITFQEADKELKELMSKYDK